MYKNMKTRLSLSLSLSQNGATQDICGISSAVWIHSGNSSCSHRVGHSQHSSNCQWWYNYMHNLMSNEGVESCVGGYIHPCKVYTNWIAC